MEPKYPYKIKQTERSYCKKKNCNKSQCLRIAQYKTVAVETTENQRQMDTKQGTQENMGLVHDAKQREGGGFFVYTAVCIGMWKI